MAQARCKLLPQELQKRSMQPPELSCWDPGFVSAAGQAQQRSHTLMTTGSACGQKCLKNS